MLLQFFIGHQQSTLVFGQISNFTPIKTWLIHFTYLHTQMPILYVRWYRIHKSSILLHIFTHQLASSINQRPLKKWTEHSLNFNYEGGGVKYTLGLALGRWQLDNYIRTKEASGNRKLEFDQVANDVTLVSKIILGYEEALWPKKL